MHVAPRILSTRSLLAISGWDWVGMEISERTSSMSTACGANNHIEIEIKIASFSNSFLLQQISFILLILRNITYSGKLDERMPQKSFVNDVFTIIKVARGLRGGVGRDHGDRGWHQLGEGLVWQFPL